jgi:acetylglutamate synthase
MAFITAATLEDAVLVRLGQAASATPSTSITAVVTDAVDEAYQEIVTVLTDRGYTAAQIAAWDRGAEYNRKIGVCLSLTNIGINHEIDEQRLDRVCKCREELLTIPILIDGVLVDPTGDAAGYGHGTMDTSEDTFVFDDMEL